MVALVSVSKTTKEVYDTINSIFVSKMNNEK